MQRIASPPQSNADLAIEPASVSDASEGGQSRLAPFIGTLVSAQIGSYWHHLCHDGGAASYTENDIQHAKSSYTA